MRDQIRRRRSLRSQACQKVFEDVRNGKLMVRKRGRTSTVEHDEVVRYVKSFPVKQPIVGQSATEIVSDGS